MSKKSKPFLAHSDLTDCIYIIDGNAKYEVTEQCIKAMKTTNRMPRWISVSEKLPEEDGEYLATIYDMDENYEYIDIAELEDGKWCYKPYILVKAWMPLPELYKQEVEDE